MVAAAHKNNMLLSLAVKRTSSSDEEDLVDAFSSWNCIGSSHGWLGYMNPKNYSFYLLKPSLVNDPSYLPFISLPSLEFLSDNPNAISKMIFSSSPTPIQRLGAHHNNNNSSILVVLTLDWLGQLGPAAAAFCRIGDPNWTTLSNFPVKPQMRMERRKKGGLRWNIFQDIAYYSKHKLFYVVTNSGEIYSWDLSNYHYCSMKQQQDCNFRCLISSPTSTFPPPLLPYEFFVKEDKKEIVNCKYYLVMDESSGALIMIRVHIYYDMIVKNVRERMKRDIDQQPLSKSYTHDVHRLDFDRLEWFLVKFLVDTALFIGRNNGIVVNVRQEPELMTPGYIYLACNADNIFQLSVLCYSSNKRSHSDSYFSILRGDMTKEDDMTSFPIWNFG